MWIPLDALLQPAIDRAKLCCDDWNLPIHADRCVSTLLWNAPNQLFWSSTYNAIKIVRRHKIIKLQPEKFILSSHYNEVGMPDMINPSFLTFSRVDSPPVLRELTPTPAWMREPHCTHGSYRRPEINRNLPRRPCSRSAEAYTRHKCPLASLKPNPLGTWRIGVLDYWVWSVPIWAFRPVICALKNKDWYVT